MFCFFVNFGTFGAAAAEEEEEVEREDSLRFWLVVVVVVVVACCCWSAEVEESEEEERLVAGFWAEDAWRVTLESLKAWMGVLVSALIVLITVGFGGLEKSISEDSLSEEVVSEADDDEDAFAFVVMVVVRVGLGASSSDSLLDSLSEGVDSESAFGAIIEAAADLDGPGVDSGSDEEVSEEDEESLDCLETGTLLCGREEARSIELGVSFFTVAAFTAGEEEVVESDSDSELEELLGSAFRLRPFNNSLTVGFREAAGIRS